LDRKRRVGGVEIEFREPGSRKSSGVRKRTAHRGREKQKTDGRKSLQSIGFTARKKKKGEGDRRGKKNVKTLTFGRSRVTKGCSPSQELHGKEEAALKEGRVERILEMDEIADVCRS